MAYFEQFKQLDGTTLLNETISTTGPGTIIDTQYYGSLSFQFNGAGTYINAQIEGSNELVDWDPVLLHSTSDLSLVDTINTTDDTYTLKTSHRYIRINASRIIGAPTVTVIGRSGAGPSAADNLSAAFNKDTPINIAFGAGVKQDASGALILSDGIPYFMQGNNTYTINLSGYSTIVLQLTATQTATVSQSIDGISFTTTSMALYGGSTFGTPAAAGIYTVPVIGQVARVVLTVAAGGPTQAAILLKQASIGPTTNLGQIGGSAVASGTAQLGVNLVQVAGSGVSGSGGIIVQGSTGIGTAPTNFPVPLGGVDTSNLTRRILTDTAGRTIVSVNALSPYFNLLANSTSNTISSSNSPIANTALPINTVGALPATYQQSAALNVQETSQYEGQGLPELLAQILLEMRIMNQQLYELPRLIATNQASSDPPETFRQEPSIFNQ